MFFLRFFFSFSFFVMGGFRKFGNHMQLFLSIPSRCDRRCVPVKQNGCEIRFVLFVIFFEISSNLITTTTLRGGVTHFFSLSGFSCNSCFYLLFSYDMPTDMYVCTNLPCDV